MTKKKGKKGKQQEEPPSGPPSQPAASASEPTPPSATSAAASTTQSSGSVAQPPAGQGKGQGRGSTPHAQDSGPRPGAQPQHPPQQHGPPGGPWAQQQQQPRQPHPQQQQQPAQPHPQQQQQPRPPWGQQQQPHPPQPQQQQQPRQPQPQQQQQQPAQPPPQQPQPRQPQPQQQQQPRQPHPQQQQQPAQPHPQQQQQPRPPWGQQQQQPGQPHPQQQQQPRPPWGQQQQPRPPQPQQQQQPRQPQPQQQQQPRQPQPQQQQQPRQPQPQQQQQQPAQPPPQQPQPRQPQPQQQQQPRQPQQQQQQPTQPQPQPQQPQPRQPQPQQAAPTPSVESLSQSMAKLSLIPRRPNPSKAGTRGRPITVEVNVVSITFQKNFNPNAVHYDIAFDPDKPKFMLRRAYDVVHEQYFPNRHPAFDGRKNLYSSGLLPFGEQMKCEVEVYDPERDQQRTFKLTISKVADVNLSWLPRVAPGMPAVEQTGLQVLDVVLRHGPASRCVQVGRSFFTPPKGQVVDLGNGLELWVGMFQSAIVGWKPFLNVDVAHKGFPKALNVVDYMREVCGYRFSPKDVDYQKAQIAKQLRGLKVIYQIPGHPTSKRSQRINDLMQSSINSRFKLDNGTQTTVYDYFLKEKGYKIQNPELPCVWVGARTRQIYVPAELCTIVGGQVTMKKMDEIQTSNMIKSAATSTDVRKQKIMDAFASINFNNDPCVKEFGLSVGGGFEKVPARVLDPPMLMYDRPVKVGRGVWNASKFNTPAHLEPMSWTILNVNGKYSSEQDLHKLSRELIINGGRCGMNLGEPLTPFTTMQPPTRDVRAILQFLEKNRNLKLIIVVVPDRGNAYSKVKQSAEIQIGVLTQCIRGRTLSRLTPATTSNILLKINAKLNGVNHLIESKQPRPSCLAVPCIIIGADVTHPPPDAVDTPSIAAVAASHDPRAQFMYNIKTQLQPPRVEIIIELQRMVREQLMFFYKTTGHKPERIIFYRDGVSEGQFGQVLNSELAAIQRACTSLSASFKPAITFLVVQKRHHVRLFPTDKRNSDDRNGNVQAGTVVDTMITHPSHIDFYLVSHASIQGVARPTKYRCLWDDSNMTEDEIEQLTYYLCHMFSRCTRSVSYPAPTYYAHLAAYRARVHTEDLPMNISNLDEEQRKKLTLADGIIKNPMFFV